MNVDTSGNEPRHGVLARARHELRTPLNAVIGYTEMLLEDSAVAPLLGPDLDAAHRLGLHLLTLLHEALGPARIAGGALDGPLHEIAETIRTTLRDPVAQLCEHAAGLALAASSADSGCRADVERIRVAALRLSAQASDPFGMSSATGPSETDVDPATAPTLLSNLQAAVPIPDPPTARAPSGGHESALLLVVDDVEANRDILSRLLERQGHHVMQAANGIDALALVAKHRFDLILLDVMMPEMDGYQALARIRLDRRFWSVPVIFISALDDVSGKVKAFRAGGADYVTKPFQAEEVVARVENQLKIFRLQRELARQNGELMRKNQELVHAQRRTDLVFSALADALPGTVLDGKYRLDEKIGAGGFGAVFRGTHLGLDLPVAIKVFRPIHGNDTPEALERFRQEGITASRVRHPNAVEILDNGISSTGIAYLVMELMQGRTVAEELRQAPVLSPQRVAQIMIPVCEALAEFHAIGMVHRDITPENIYLHNGRKGEIVKLLDFGLSKMLGAAEGQTLVAVTTTGWVMGTPAYMAPERLLNGACDGRADVYSIGVIMYRMLCGRPPFQSEAGNYALAVQHLTGNVEPLGRHNPEVPRALDELVRRTLAKDPADRPTASELAQLLGVAVGLPSAVDSR